MTPKKILKRTVKKVLAHNQARQAQKQDLIRKQNNRIQHRLIIKDL